MVADGDVVEFESGYFVETLVEGDKLGVVPHTIRVSPEGELFAVDATNNNIVRITPPLSQCMIAVPSHLRIFSCNLSLQISNSLRLLCGQGFLPVAIRISSLFFCFSQDEIFSSYGSTLAYFLLTKG